MEKMTRKELYQTLRERLAPAGSEADTQARLLMEHVLCKPWSQVMLHFEAPVREEDQRKLIKMAEERVSGRPLAYVMGVWYFYGAPYLVDERVLIPRFDSECVAQVAIETIKRNGFKTAADVCCGSGCLGITLARECELDEVLLTDNSPQALEVARCNAKALLGDGRAKLVLADLLLGLASPVDLIICNPPYVSATQYEDLEEQIRLYEPKNALVAPENGFSFYERLALEAKEKLHPGGILVAEIGDHQAQHVAELFDSNRWENIQIGKDFSGMPRYIVACTGSRRD